MGVPNASDLHCFDLAPCLLLLRRGFFLGSPSVLLCGSLGSGAALTAARLLPMFLRSLFYERTVLRHLERVRQLSVEVQTDIAARVSNFIEQARTVSDEQLERFAQAAHEEQQRAGGKSDMDPARAAPAISEAWCKAKLGLATGSLNQHSAIEIIVAIETFTSKRASDHQRTGR
jgi:hypothetical protein